MAAHLAGTVAALTVKPVIGVPMDADPLKGQDALLSMVQMPGGIPVACVVVGTAGAKNAAYLAAQIMALANPDFTTRLLAERRANAAEIAVKNEALRKKYGG